MGRDERVGYQKGNSIEFPFFLSPAKITFYCGGKDGRVHCQDVTHGQEGGHTSNQLSLELHLF